MGKPNRKTFLSLCLIGIMSIQMVYGQGMVPYKVLYHDYALLLFQTGVLQGTDTKEDTFQLSREANRLEALIILIRLLGEETTAKENKYPSAPFTDVPEWGKAYVDYAYAKGLTTGINEKQFGYELAVTAEQFTTFMLRVLGYKDKTRYDDQKGDFYWKDAVDFAKTLGMIEGDFYESLMQDPFLRDHVAKLAYETLETPMKQKEITLKTYLSTGSITAPKEETPKEEAPVVTVGVPLVGAATATQAQVYRWAKSKGMDQTGLDLIDLYYELSEAVGLDPVIQYVQMCIETGWMYKNGSLAGLDATFHNPCGLKTTEGGGDYEANAHMRFDSWRDGVSAHIDHSALYAGLEGFPKGPGETKDPRHFSWLLGRGDTIETMSLSWATSTWYQDTMLRLYNEVIQWP